MGFLKSLLFLIIIPIFGFVVSIWVISDINQSLATEGLVADISQLCSENIHPQLTDKCDELSPLLWMKTGSIICAIIGVLLLISFIFSAHVAGEDRTKIARIFPPLIFITLVVLSGLVLAQGALLTYGAYVAEAYVLESVHWFLIGAIALISGVAGFGLISASINMTNNQIHSILGIKLDPKQHPQLFDLIGGISHKLGAIHPQHVVVGLEPNFYVTSSDVYVIGDEEELKGETLYLSMPLARILSTEELKAIIGHELGHFRGEDTYYSLKFSPVYSGLSHAMATLGHDDPEDGGSIITLPAYTVLSYMIEVFHANVSTVSRKREFAADNAASEVAEPKSLASSLLKMGLYANAWYALQNTIVERLQKGKSTKNLSQLFSGIVKYDVNTETIPEAVKEIAEETIVHPTDSHPSTSARISALGLNIDDIESELLNVPEFPCVNLIDGAMNIEETLTELQQEYYISMGVEVGNHKATVNVISAFGAHMVVADGVVDSNEIDKAESIGLEMDGQFDFIEFREYCQYPEDIPKLKDLFVVCQKISKHEKFQIFKYMKLIASADGSVSKEEKQLLLLVKSKFESQ